MPASSAPPAPPPAGDPFDRDDWWDATSPHRLLHDITPLRLRWLRDQTGALRGKRLLDVGCGGGIFAEAAARAGARVTGLDAAAKAIASARRHAQQSGLPIHYEQANSPSHLPDSSYDIVTCFEVLEHVPTPSALVADIARKLAPGGIAAFSTINRTLPARFLMITMLEGLIRLLPAHTHTYAQFIRPSELAAWCHSHDLTIRDVTGMTYSFFGHYYRLTPHDTRVNYFLAATRPA